MVGDSDGSINAVTLHRETAQPNPIELQFHIEYGHVPHERRVIIRKRSSETCRREKSSSALDGWQFPGIEVSHNDGSRDFRKSCEIVEYRAHLIYFLGGHDARFGMH